jgi:hypothetical protein
MIQMAYVSVAHSPLSADHRRSGGFLHRVAGVLEMIGAAARVAGAIDAHRRPDIADLRALGLNADAFAKLGW